MPKANADNHNLQSGFINFLLLAQATNEGQKPHLATVNKAKTSTELPNVIWIQVITIPKLAGNSKSRPKFLRREGIITKKINMECKIVAEAVISPCFLSFFF